MKFLNTVFWVLFVTAPLFSQTLEIVPAQGNPVLRSFAEKIEAENAKLVEQLTGRSPLAFSEDSRVFDCPPDLEGYFVTAGQSIEIELDTFGLMDGEEEVTLTIENNDDLLFGSAQLDTTVYLTYAASSSFTGAGIETIQIKLSQPGHDTIFSVEIYVRRKARVVVTESQTVQPESITTFCLDSELDFAKPKLCSTSYNCPDDYDGKGFTVWHLSSYEYPDTCLVYYASRFPGVDTVCMTICDEWGVCDVFKVPYIIPGDTISIAAQPFFDDFSAYDGPYPSSDFWLDKNVYRNSTLAKDPPSVGLVTFDGLDRRGRVYNIFEGVGDRLTSKAIDLSGYTAADNVALRFFIAPKGYGLSPDIEDVMALEFRNNEREWVAIDTYAVMGSISFDSFPPFEFKGIPLNDPQFLHEGFQFRFSANTSPGGEVDMWHLDYVRLAANEGSEEFFPDIAFTQLPTPPLKNYTAMPYKHLKGHVEAELTNDIKAHFYNHYDDVRAIAQSSVTYTDLVTGTTLSSPFPVNDSGNDNNLDPMTHEERDRTIPSDDYGDLIADLNILASGSLGVLQTKFAIVPSAQGADFASNDTVTINNIFSNYFAHDDGTAEWQISLGHSQGDDGQHMAAHFHTNEDDVLKAVQILFPHVNSDVQNQLFNLKVWVGDLDLEPEFVRPLLKPFYPSNVYDTLQGFTTYVLDNFAGELMPLSIPAGDFYIGIEQSSADEDGIPVGYDLQNACDCNWVTLNGEDWSKLYTSVPGALMIRAVFGDVDGTSGSVEVPETTYSVQVYPNPTTGTVNFELPDDNFQDYRVAVYNQLGQRLISNRLERRLDMKHLPNGIYFVQILDEKTGKRFDERIVLAKD